jgi:septum formation protein
MMQTSLILASKSQARSQLLKNAGLTFSCEAADIDERAAEKPLLEAGAPPEDIASILAQAKAMDVSAKNPGKLVIGADQTLGCGDQRFNKPEDDAQARRQLLALAGKSHNLHSAICCAKDGEILWETVSTATLTMRSLTPEEVGQYMAQVGDAVRSSVGCYQLEGIGIQLFEKIEGDYFTILGLPLLPLLGYLRAEHGLMFDAAAET